MQKDKKYYDDFFTKHNANIHDNSARFNAVCSLLNGKVLDIACGTGTLSKYYTGDYAGVDISDVAIEKAKEERRKDVFFEVGDFTKKFHGPIELFDCVYLGEFLEHIKDDDMVFQNISNQLQHNGKIIVSVPNGERVPDESHCRIFTVPRIRRQYSKYGKITFHTWEGFSDRILFTIEPFKKILKEIALVMIVKDEAKGLEKAILSALPIVDKVVISVDSKSRDNTHKIANLYADEVKVHEWENDFSKARNSAQKDVGTKWILFLDGHEYIESYGDFKDKIKYNVDGVFVTIRMESNLTFLYPRIYKSHIQFKNKVHNVNECKTRRVSPKFVIVHDREGGQDTDAIERRNKQRDEMMPNELKNQIKENPKNPRPHFHLANYYMMRQKHSLAMKHFKKAIKFGKSPDEKYLCYLHYGMLCVSKKRPIRALWNFNSANQLLPGRWESARVIGGFYYMQKNYKKAVDYLVHALTPNPRRFAYEPMQMNKIEIWDMIAMSFAKLDQNEKAVIAWKRATELTDDKKQKHLFKQKIDLVETLIEKK